MNTRLWILVKQSILKSRSAKTTKFFSLNATPSARIKTNAWISFSDSRRKKHATRASRPNRTASCRSSTLDHSVRFTNSRHSAATILRYSQKLTTRIKSLSSSRTLPSRSRLTFPATTPSSNHPLIPYPSQSTTNQPTNQPLFPIKITEIEQCPSSTISQNTKDTLWRTSP